MCAKELEGNLKFPLAFRLNEIVPEQTDYSWVTVCRFGYSISKCTQPGTVPGRFSRKIIRRVFGNGSPVWMARE